MTTSGRVLLADDSPHAQRMGERILREEGFEVVTVTDGETAIIRLKDVDPDVVIVDAFLPQVSGYDLCGYIKKQPQHSHVKVLLTSTALERVDEDQAYKAGADGQLKKPFEASVMLKSLKDLIGGSDKKKRTGTTSLDLSYNDEPSSIRSESTSADSDAEETSTEKPVSALQAWLQQHDSGSYADTGAEDLPLPEETPAPEPAAVSLVEEVASVSEGLSNPQLLRRPEEEPEDLSLRNNPVARLRNTVPPSTETRPLASPAESPAGSAKSGVRSIRVPSAVPSPEEAPVASSIAEPSRPPRKSLLEQLEEFEKATAEGGAEIAANATFASFAASAASSESDTSVAEEPRAASPQVKSEDVVSSQTPVAAASPEEPAEAEAEAESVAEEGEEEILLLRSRTGRSARPSILEAIGSSADEEDALEASHVGPREDDISASDVSATASVEAALSAANAARETVAVSLSDAGVRLDEEEVRAVVEIAVSAAMPTIVEEVSRCVLLALESRYAEKVSVDGGH